MHFNLKGLKAIRSQFVVNPNFKGSSTARGWRIKGLMDLRGRSSMILRLFLISHPTLQSSDSESVMASEIIESSNELRDQVKFEIMN